MTTRAQAQLALRPLLPADVPDLAEIFRASIGQKIAGELTLVATYGGAAIGFASLASNKKIDMLYVHPAAAGQGAGAMLCDALEKLAAARGSKELTVEASDNARGFFEKRGFVARTRNTVSLAGEWLANTTMSKALAAPKGTLQ
jgi:putative acetyltransferase